MCLITKSSVILVVVSLVKATPGVCAAGAKAYAVPTFESLGLYYDRSVTQDSCAVHYRAAGAIEWREGYPCVYDARGRQYRGSLVQLRPDTLYEIRLDAGGDRKSTRLNSSH